MPKVTSAAHDNDYYRTYLSVAIFFVIAGIFLLIGLIILLIYEVENRPLPHFTALTPNKEAFELTASEEPNLLSSTIIKWASKAAIDTYTYKFSESDSEIEAKIKPYFTANGLSSFYKSIQGVIQILRQNQLNTNSTVNGQPVISNQGDFYGNEMAWRVQIPFIVTYEAAGSSSTKSYRVTLIIVKVPTTKNPVGIGIDRYSM
jgi:intracellular multiplication protein IcmL